MNLKYNQDDNGHTSIKSGTDLRILLLKICRTDNHLRGYNLYLGFVGLTVLLAIKDAMTSPEDPALIKKREAEEAGNFRSDSS